jgi:hypothetical protein
VEGIASGAIKKRIVVKKEKVNRELDVPVES